VEKVDSAEHTLRDNLLRQEFSEAQANVKQEIETSLNEVREEQKQHAAKLDEALAAQQSQLEQVESRLSSLDQGLDALRRELERHIVGEFASAKSSLDALDSSLTLQREELTQYMDTSTQQLERVRQEVTEQTEEGLKRTASEMEALLAKAEATLNGTLQEEASRREALQMEVAEQHRGISVQLENAEKAASEAASAQETRYVELSSSVADNVNTVAAAVQAVGGKLSEEVREAFQTRGTELAEAEAALKQHLEQLQASVHDQGERMQALEGGSAELLSQLTSLTEQLSSDMLSTRGEFIESIGVCEARIKEVADAADELAASMGTKLDDERTAWQAAVEAAQGKLDEEHAAWQAAVEAARGDVTTCQAATADLDTQLQARLQELQATLEEKCSELSTSSEAATTKLEELQGELARIEESTEQLQAQSKEHVAEQLRLVEGQVQTAIKEVQRGVQRDMSAVEKRMRKLESSQDDHFMPGSYSVDLDF